MGIFVTGTDTGVGKTLVSCALLRALHDRGHRIGVYKPSETGCPEGEGGELYGEDCRRLLAAAATEQPEASVSTALYPIPAAPLVSAEAAGETIDPQALLRDYESVASSYDAAWAEGAGGLLVPIARDYLFSDFAASLGERGVPTLVVVGSKLGCINHALLTLSELKRRGIPILGYVMNGVQSEAEGEAEAPYAVASNRATLARFTDVPDLGMLPHVASEGRDDFAALAKLAEAELAVDSVEKALLGTTRA